MRWTLLPLTALALCAGAPSAPLPMEPQHGLWTARIDGRQPYLCFETDSTHSLEFGKLYVAGDPDIHELSRQNNEPVFKEWDHLGNLVATIRFETANAATLGATRDAGGKLLSIEFTAVPVAEGGEGSCASDAFLAPRLATLARKTEQRSFDGIGYSGYALLPDRSYDDVEMQSLALDGSQPGDAAINAKLHAHVTAWGPGDDYQSCRVKNGGGKYGFQFELEPTFLSSRLLATKTRFQGLCGGSPDYGITFSAFDRASGKDLAIKDWFRPGALISGKETELAQILPSPALLKAIVAALPSGKNEGLFQLMDETGMHPDQGIQLMLDRKGIGFANADARSYPEPSVVPWKEIRPFLKPEVWAMLHRSE